MIQPVEFFCGANKLYGILHTPKRDPHRAAVIIVTGGPQTRIGSHRLYVQLAQYLSSNGITVLRFDYEGSGDSEGPSKGFNHAVPSIDSAIDYIASNSSNETRIFLWSICDGCLPSLWHSMHYTSKISGLILCNPFVMCDPERSSIRLRRYYLPLIFQKKTWLKALKWKLKFKHELKTISSHLANILLKTRTRKEASNTPERLKSVTQFIANATNSNHLVTCFLSENDLIAKTLFDLLDINNLSNDLCSNSRFSYKIIPKADHTFTSFQSKRVIFDYTLNSIRQMLMATEGCKSLNSAEVQP